MGIVLHAQPASTTPFRAPAVRHRCCLNRTGPCIRGQPSCADGRSRTWWADNESVG